MWNAGAAAIASQQTPASAASSTGTEPIAEKVRNPMRSRAWRIFDNGFLGLLTEISTEIVNHFWRHAPEW
jgi:hypothetical protein